MKTDWWEGLWLFGSVLGYSWGYEGGNWLEDMNGLELLGKF
jgi:hypothetical protein